MIFEILFDIHTVRGITYKNNSLVSAFDTLVYTGFPPEDTLNDVTRPRVEESWENISQILRLPKDDRIRIRQNGKICNIQ